MLSRSLTLIVSLLLAQPSAKDTIRDDQGRTVLEAAATPEVVTVVEGERQPRHG